MKGVNEDTTTGHRLKEIAAEGRFDRRTPVIIGDQVVTEFFALAFSRGSGQIRAS